MIKADTSLLMLIDFQGKLMPAIDDGLHVVASAEKLAKVAQLLKIPVVATEQNPKGLGGTLDSLAAYPSRTLPKHDFDASRAQDFGTLLDPRRPQLVITGCEAHICVLQTALGLIDAGHEVIVVEDAGGSRRPENRAAALKRLERHGAEIVTAEMVIFEWLGSAANPAFRNALAIIK